MTFQIINRPGHGMATLHEHSKVATMRPHTGLLRSRTRLAVQARYSGDDGASRRPARPNRGFDDDDDGEQRRPTRPAQSSWDEDFDAPSRMDKSRGSRDNAQDGGYGEGRGAQRGGDGGYSSSGRGSGSGRGGYNSGSGGSSWAPGGNQGAAADEAGGQRQEGYRGRGGGAGGSSYRGPSRSSGEQGERRPYGGDQGERRPYGGDQGERRPYGGGDQGGRGGGGGYDRNARNPRDAMTYDQLSQRMALNQTIKDASSWRELAAFVEEKGSIMDAENVAAILIKLSSRQPSRQQASGASAAYGRGDFARPRDEEEAQEFDRLLSTLLGWVLVLMPSFRPRQVSMCLQSLSKLELWNLEVVTALVQTCIKQMGNMEASDYGNILGAFAKFNYSPGQEFFDSFLLASQRKLQQMYPSDIGKTVAAMTKLGCVPTAPWAEAFWKATSDKIMDDDFADITSGDVLMAVAYFAQAGVQPPQPWVDRVFGAYVETEPERAARAAQLNKAYAAQLEALEREQMKAKDDVKPEPTPPRPQLPERPLPKVHIINKLLYTLSNLSCRPGPAWFGAIIDAWRRQFPYCSPTDLGNIALYLGRYLQVPVSTGMCAQLLKETMKQVSRMRGDDIAAVAYLLSASRFKGTDKEIDDMVFFLKPRLPECSLSGLELVYNALPQLGSGYRLNETVAEAANRYNEMSAAQAAQGAEAQVQAEAEAVAA